MVNINISFSVRNRWWKNRFNWVTETEITTVDAESCL